MHRKCVPSISWLRMFGRKLSTIVISFGGENCAASANDWALHIYETKIKDQAKKSHIENLSGMEVLAMIQSLGQWSNVFRRMRWMALPGKNGARPLGQTTSLRCSVTCVFKEPYLQNIPYLSGWTFTSLSPYSWLTKIRVEECGKFNVCGNKTRLP